jgi:hypothetical protein
LLDTFRNGSRKPINGLPVTYNHRGLGDGKEFINFPLFDGKCAATSEMDDPICEPGGKKRGEGIQVNRKIAYQDALLRNLKNSSH